MTRRLWSIMAAVSLLVTGQALAQAVIVAEGERFAPEGKAGWVVTHQDDSYASHTYGGMWVTHGGGLSVPIAAEGAVAVQRVKIPAAGDYRVWSKYQAPPYFSYPHRVEVVQGGKTLFTHDYGKVGTPRLWSFSAESDELWWPWGIDHDAAEAPERKVALAAGEAEIRLVSIPGPVPSADPFVDFVLLTTNAASSYQGFKPYGVGTPFAFEALAATELYMRFQNTAGQPSRLAVSRAGHFQPNYGGATVQIPDAPVAAGQWSPWTNIGPFCRLVHNEGLQMKLGAASFKVQFARDAAGKDIVGDFEARDGDVAVVPIDITWSRDARVQTSREHAGRIADLSRKTWRQSNGGKKPQQIPFYGAFSGQEPWVAGLKDVLGYNTLLPDGFQHLAVDGYHQHAGNSAAIKALADKLGDKKASFRVLSFGDEIDLGSINYGDAAMQAKFVAWLKGRKLTEKELGVAADGATLTPAGNSRLAWYTQLFNEEERFASYRALTEQAKREIGPQVLTGANYSPHHQALCYGPVYKWVDIFKHGGMSLFWAEDYIFSVPEVPQIISWMCAQMRCGVKYRRQPIHFYVMPHAPGQEAGFFRRNLLLCIGSGVAQIDNFWVAPEERFTENYVAWGRDEMFRAISEGIHDTAEAEKLQVGSTLRPARVAVVLSKATDFNETRLKIDPSRDPFVARCRNAVGNKGIEQTLGRKDQQMLYLALRQSPHAVDLVTEDDIVDGILKDYRVVYFAGEWIDERTLPVLDQWVSGGGILYMTAGMGCLNQFGEKSTATLKLLGLKDVSSDKRLWFIRTLLELPLAAPVDTLTLEGASVPAVGLKQTLVPDTAKVLGTWSDGSAAVTVNEKGKGKVFAVGTLAGNSYIKTGLKAVPFARGGRRHLYNPTGFSEAATRLVRLGLEAGGVEAECTSSASYVESAVLDQPGKGTLLTLVNWGNEPIAETEVAVKMAAAPASVRSVEQQKDLPFEFRDGRAIFKTRLNEADYFLLKSK